MATNDDLPVFEAAVEQRKAVLRNLYDADIAFLAFASEEWTDEEGVYNNAFNQAVDVMQTAIDQIYRERELDWSFWDANPSVHLPTAVHCAICGKYITQDYDHADCYGVFPAPDKLDAVIVENADGLPLLKAAQ